MKGDRNRPSPAQSAPLASDPAGAKDPGQTAGFADRLYILDGGYGRSGNAGAWQNMLLPPGTPVDISSYAYAIRHGDTWMMFDTSSNDIIATMPSGFLHGGANGIRWMKTPAQTMTAQLKLVGIAPDDVSLIGISHQHADHTGNIGLFRNSTVLIQRVEYDQAMAKGASPQGPPNMPGQIFERSHPVRLLDGDFDVFGDGSVRFFYVGGHTVGCQVCLVHLKNAGYVLLSGDAVHFRSNFDTRRIPRIEMASEANRWLWSGPLAYERVAALLSHYKAQLWVHHDIEDFKGRKFAPEYYD
ncbi:MAG TPA: N-acyl homoserine lactonase family protein [Candidatus Dormibacteraeota bacterium]|nr:N-acyl homoserine lactonase family protein [Candidatus Dormibacteraeota bacterium]